MKHSRHTHVRMKTTRPPRRGSQGATITAGGCEFSRVSPREAGNSVLVKTEAKPFTRTFDRCAGMSLER